MKKFPFGLDTVRDYTTQILEALQAEHGAILAQVRKQEEVLRRLEHRYGQTNEAFCEKKKTGLSVADALAFETGLRALEKDIHREGENWPSCAAGKRPNGPKWSRPSKTPLLWKN